MKFIARKSPVKGHMNIDVSLHSKDKEMQGLHPHEFDMYTLKGKEAWIAYEKAAKLNPNIIKVTMLVQLLFKRWFLQGQKQDLVFVDPEANESDKPYKKIMLGEFGHSNVLCYICEERMNILADLHKNKEG